MSEPDLYALLGVSREADADAIKKAYRRKALELHPDRNPGDQAAEEGFKAASEAYQVLSDPQKRALYDRHGMAGVRAGTGGFQEAQDVFSHFQDIFADFFGFSGGAGFDPRAYRTAPRRGADLRLMMRVSLDEAYEGLKREFDLEVEGADGRRETRKVRVAVPAGIDSGQTLRVSGQGQPGMNGGPAGHLYVTVEVEGHELYQREGADLLYELELSFPQAVLGDEIEVPLLGGGMKKLKVPAGTQAGETLVVQEAGMPRLNGRGRGRLICIAHVTVPKRLSGKAKKLVKQLAEELS